MIMACRWRGDKPLSKPMMVSLLTHIYVTWPLWFNFSIIDISVMLDQFNYFHIWQVSPQIICSDTSQIFTWYSTGEQYSDYFECLQMDGNWLSNLTCSSDSGIIKHVFSFFFLMASIVKVSHILHPRRLCWYTVSELHIWMWHCMIVYFQCQQNVLFSVIAQLFVVSDMWNSHPNIIICACWIHHEGRCLKQHHPLSTHGSCQLLIQRYTNRWLRWCKLWWGHSDQFWNFRCQNDLSHLMDEIILALEWFFLMISYSSIGLYTWQIIIGWDNGLVPVQHWASYYVGSEKIFFIISYCFIGLINGKSPLV